MGIWRLGRCAIYFFYGPDGPKVQKWTFPGSAPTRPSCLSTCGGAIGISGPSLGRVDPGKTPQVMRRAFQEAQIHENPAIGHEMSPQSGERTWPEWPEWPEIAGSKRFQANGSRKQ